jgi:hypothetical protein
MIMASFLGLLAAPRIVRDRSSPVKGAAPRFAIRCADP